MWKLIFVSLLLILTGYQVWSWIISKTERQFLIVWLFAFISLGFVYLCYGLDPDEVIEVLPLLLALIVVGVILYVTLKGKESVAGFSALAILTVGGLLYYMIVFLDYEILGTYTLRNIKKYDEQLLSAKASLDSLDRFHREVIRKAETAKREIEVQLEKIALYSADVANTQKQIARLGEQQKATEASISRLVEQQKLIEDTIANFNKNLSKITQQLIAFSFLIGGNPQVSGGGIVPEFKRELVQITRSLGKRLKFDSDSLLSDIDKKQIELDKEFDKK